MYCMNTIKMLLGPIDLLSRANKLQKNLKRRHSVTSVKKVFNSTGECRNRFSKMEGNTVSVFTLLILIDSDSFVQRWPKGDTIEAFSCIRRYD